MLIFKMAFKNIIRRRTRSLFSLLGVFTSSLLFVVGLSWLYGVYDNLISSTINNSGHIRIVSQRYHQQEMMYPIEEHMTDVDEIIRDIKKIAPSSEVFPSIKQPVLINNPKRQFHQLGIVVATPLEFQRRLFKNSICQGAVSQRSGITIGSHIAQQLQIQIQDEIVLLGKTVDGSFSPQKYSVQRIIHCDDYLINHFIFVDISIGRYMIDVENSATDIIIFDEAEEIDTTRFDQKLWLNTKIFDSGGKESSYFIEYWYERKPLSEILPLSLLMNGIFAILLTIMVVISIINPMMMMVWERRKEFLLLRSMGFSKEQIIAILVLENCILTTCAIVPAIIIGYGYIHYGIHTIDISDSISGISQNITFSTKISPKWRASILPIIVICLGYTATLIGTIFPIFRVLQMIKNPYDILRSSSS